MRKFVSMLLALALIFTCVSPVSAQEGEIHEPNAAAITPGKAIAIKEASGSRTYTFTPPANGLYRFYSYDLEMGDPMAEIADEEGGWIADNDDLYGADGDWNFEIYADLQGGIQYTFRVMENKDDYYQCKIKLETVKTVGITLYGNGGVFWDDEAASRTLQIPSGMTLKKMGLIYSDVSYPYLKEGDKGFAGWASSASGQPLADDYVIKTGDKLYAVWEDTCIVTLHGCGGTMLDYDPETEEEKETGIFTTTVLKGALFSDEIFSEFTKNGYYFLGWSTAENSQETINIYQYAITQDTDFYSVWLKPGTNAKALALDETAAVSKSSQQFSFKPTKSGYYSFFSHTEKSSLINDPRCTLYDSKGIVVDTADDNNERDFRLSVELAAGETYYLITSTYSGAAPDYEISVHAGAKKVTLDANGQIWEDRTDGNGEDLVALEEHIFQPWELDWLNDSMKYENRLEFLGWAFDKDAQMPALTPDSEISEIPANGALYAVWRKWNEYSLDKTIAVVPPVDATGEALKPEFNLWFGMQKLKAGTDYEVTGYENNVEPGEGTIRITGLGRFAGQEKTVTFEIVEAVQSIEKAKVTGIKTKTYTGKKIKQKIKVTLDGITLIGGTDYKVTYKKNKAAGKATLIVTGIGKYTGTIKKTFKIKPAATAFTTAKNSAKKTVTLKWNKAKSGTGYQIQYAAKKNFKGKKTVTVKKLKTTSQKIKKLKKGKTYYFRIRVYKTVGKTKLYSKWSAVKKVKIKK